MSSEWTKVQVSAVARALCKDSSQVCNVNNDDNWTFHSADFIHQATIALGALATLDKPADAGVTDVDASSALRLFDCICNGHNRGFEPDREDAMRDVLESFAARHARQGEMFGYIGPHERRTMQKMGHAQVLSHPLPQLGIITPVYIEAQPEQAKAGDAFLPNGTRVMWQSSNGAEFPATITAFNSATYDAKLDDGTDANGFDRARFTAALPTKDADHV